jgi:hypothetical protein
MVMSRVFNPMSLRKICVGVFANNQAGDYASSTKAEKLFQRRVILSETAFAEIVIWHVPAPISGSIHAYKYRLAYVIRGECVLRYDNEAGKGDHRHINGREEAYRFSSPRQLMTDFFEEIRRWSDEHADD